MDSETHPHSDLAWRELLSRLPANLDLDQSARTHGALSYIATSLLDNDVRGPHAERRLRVVDGSLIRSSGKGGMNWRLHATYDPAEGRFSQLEISDMHAGESLSRHTFERGDLLLGTEDMPGRRGCCMCAKWSGLYHADRLVDDPIAHTERRTAGLERILRRNAAGATITGAKPPTLLPICGNTCLRQS